MADALKVLSYEGVIGIDQIPGIGAQWQDLADSGHSLIINLSRVETIDLTFIQLLLSAKQTLQEKSLSLQVANLVSTSVLEAFVFCGIIAHSRLSGRELDAAIDRFLGERG